MADKERDIEAVLKRFHQLQERRKNWDIQWHETAEIIWPQADEFVVKRAPGEKRSQKIFDATAALALEKFAAIMESLLTPRAQKWHRLRASDEALNQDSSVKDWFDEVNRILFAVRNSPKANYYSQKHEGYKSLGAFGNDCLFVDELEPRQDNPSGGIRYKYCHIGQIYIEVDNHGSVDTIYRLFPMTAKAAEQEWGDLLPPKVATALKEKPWEEFEFLHVVMPNPDVDPERIDAQGKLWVSLYIGVLDKQLIEEGGYDENPYMYSRYTVNPMEKYGRGPASLVLPAILTTQQMQQTFLRSGHKVTDPPLLVHNEGVIGTGSQKVRLVPGGLNYGAVNSQGQPLIVPLQTGARLDLTEGMLEKEREVINEAFLVRLFQILVDNPQMTATEVLLRAQEKGQLIAPAIGRQQSEMLGPQIQREVSILARLGVLPPLPSALQEAAGEYEIEYESDAVRFQRSSELAGADRTVERALAMAQFDPTAVDVIKADEVVRLSAEVEGAPNKLLRTPEEVAERQQAREQIQQAQTALEAGESGARIAKDAAQAEAASPTPAGAGL